MTDYLSFSLAAIALLAVPGPTNAVLAVAGATVGLRRSLVLLCGAIGGYLVAIGALTQVVPPLLAGYPAVPVVAKILASAYLVWLAMRLWRDPGDAGVTDSPISTSAVFLTTLLNPKSLIFAFVIFPSGSARELIPFAILFTALVVGCGGMWITLGAAIGHAYGGGANARRVARASAIVLAVFAGAIALSAAARLLT